MWIILIAKDAQWKECYLTGLEKVRWQRSAPDEWCDDFTRSQDRDEAHRFSSKQEAKDFMAKHSITGSIIPA